MFHPLPDPLPNEGVHERGHGPRDVAGDGQVRGERRLHLCGRGREVSAAAVVTVVPVEAAVGDGVGADVAELVVPERGHGDEEVPREHRAHAEVQEGKAAICEKMRKIIDEYQ